MKLKTLAVIMAAGMAASAFGQGVLLKNVATGAGGTNGAVSVNGVLFNGLVDNLGVTVAGGPSAGSLTAIGTYTAATDAKGYTGLDVGMFELGLSGVPVNIPGVSAGGTAWIQLDMWYNGPTAGGLFNSFAAASTGGGFVGTVLFAQGTSNLPLTPAGPLNGMPNVNLVVVPEPSTLALAGLGLASLLALRRRS